MRGVGGEAESGGGGDMVTLATVLKCRGAPLKEEETWALLAATATTVQDALLSGEGVYGVVVCPEGVALRRCGRVELLPTTAAAHALFLPPIEEQHDGERVLVFSLGRTLWEAAGAGCEGSGGSGGGGVSPSLRSTLAAMTHSLPAHRLALVHIFQLLVERLDTRNALNYTATVRALHEEACGGGTPPAPTPDPAPLSFGEARGRSYSALEPRTSSSRNLSRASEQSVSVEDLRAAHLSLQSAVHNPDSLPRSASILGQSRATPRPTPRTSLHEGQISKEAEERSLVRAKRTFHSLGSLSTTKENVPPATSTPTSTTSALHMSPIQEAPQGRPADQSGSTGKASCGVEPKTTVTVGRSATVAGDIKVHG
ncbi:uncharacterized protein LOC123515060 isoform X3 [Portunus trituberculatus]|uniref:uncharacterized protein LOC123515060 isoform X3 n=1 Tax=Portunus trituberculatus TaxID=210409 RepID=UPI001E1CCABC|nr:uncharacterized protein LOC123515060 isoform X3 [Portunus trituberculatus]